MGKNNINNINIIEVASNLIDNYFTPFLIVLLDTYFFYFLASIMRIVNEKSCKDTSYNLVVII